MTENILTDLPDENIGLVLVKNDIKTVNALREAGFTVLSPAGCDILPDEVSEHADMLCCFTDIKTAVVEPGQTLLKRELEKYGFTVVFSEPLEKDYPGDIKLNTAVRKKYALGNFRYVSPAVTERLCGRTLIDVKQGYAGCSTCFLSDSAVITEDEGIARALAAYGADVLIISKGDIFLSEKHYGFFGGASGMLTKDLLAVTGSLKHHRDGEKIKAFAEKHSVRIKELSDGKITDIGGIINVFARF